MTAAVGAALASHQIGAADDGRGDDAQLIALAERIDGGALPADDQDGCQTPPSGRRTM